ncbi:MAG: hypothetical protein MI784_13160 [Cytophagales bacterium]|nr:hypothetical protein [Cytophagales bacterium]
MSKRNKILSILVGWSVCALWSCGGHREVPALGDREVQLMDKVNICFSPDRYQNVVKEDEGIFRLESGRLWLKKVRLPDYNRTAQVTLDITLKSAGDRWDKAGSFFVIPAESKINFKTIKEGKNKFPKEQEGLEGFPGILAQGDYKPAIELLRFMTPFGVGYYNDKMDLRKPVYIPHWAEDVRWSADVTDQVSRLEGEVWVGVWIDTWTKEGYEMSASLRYKESKISCDVQKKTHVEPVLNTTAYIGGQKGTDVFSRADISTVVDIPENAKNVRLHYITTGHGGHSEGDEFVKKRNIVRVDSRPVIDFVPWRDDCASFRRFNPGTGVWVQKDTTEYIDMKDWKYKVKVIEERISSSDFSRSNWCPGSQVDPYVVLLDLTTGKHTIEFSIPDAQQLKPGELNFWMVSAYLTWEE